jgi:3-oxoacyl-[acyl-carrier protein] reductase
MIATTDIGQYSSGGQREDVRWTRAEKFAGQAKKFEVRSLKLRPRSSAACREEDVRAIVTGGSRGIGLAIAKAILAAKGQVMITGLDGDRLGRSVQMLGQASGDPARVDGAAVDVRNRAGVEKLVGDAVRKFGGLDLLVNNAGVGAFADVATMSDDEWARVIDTNLTGVFLCTRAAIPAIKKSGGGWIVNIASLAGRNYFPGGAAYCASKAGLIAFSESVMQEVRYDNIRVSVVMPGSVATEFSGPTASSEDSWKLSPDDVAEVVMDLVRHPGRSLPSKVEIRPSKPKSR